MSRLQGEFGSPLRSGHAAVARSPVPQVCAPLTIGALSDDGGEPTTPDLGLMFVWKHCGADRYLPPANYKRDMMAVKYPAARLPWARHDGGPALGGAAAMIGPVVARQPDVASRAEVAGEFRRYRADYLVAHAPRRASLLAGAIAGLGVYCVPLLVLSASFTLLQLTYTVAMPVAELVYRPIRGAMARSGTPATAQPSAVPATSPPAWATSPGGVEGALEQSGGWQAAAGLVAYWPIVMVMVGVVIAALYQWRRRRRLDELERTPLEFSILMEVALFYVLTAGAGLLVGMDAFVALGANAVFAWAGFLIWRWLHTLVLWPIVPATIRHEVTHRLSAEQDYRRQLREGG